MTKPTTGGTTDNIILELTPAEAELFVLFRKYQQTIEMLNKNGVFDIGTGMTVLHFNDNVLKKIEVTKVYSRII